MLAAIIALVFATPFAELSLHTLIPTVEASPKVWTIDEMKTLATNKAKEHGLKVQKFLQVIECESGWDRFAVGDSGTSFGLVQIHNPGKDWGMTIEEAYDPEVAIETMALKWSVGEAWRWSCWSPG